MLRQIWQRIAGQQPAAASTFLLAVQQPVLPPNSSFLRSLEMCAGMQQQLQQAVLQQQSYRTLASSTQQQPPQVKQEMKKQKQREERPPFFWNNLSSKIASRKPAIKRPARHQWHFCDPDYHPMMPKPTQHLPPYANARAHAKNYRAIMLAGMPKHNRNRYRRMWAKNMAITDQRWRQNWERKLAAKRKEEAKVQRMTERIIRQRSWEVWKAEQAAAAAVAAKAAPGLGEPAAMPAAAASGAS